MQNNKKTKDIKYRIRLFKEIWQFSGIYLGVLLNSTYV